MGCAAQADGIFSSFVWRCTRRSECRRAEEKNGWLWSPKQQCVKIVSFSPSNLSCRKTGKVQLCLFLTQTVSDFLCSLLLSLFSLQYLTPLTCSDWVINWVRCESKTSSSRSSSSVLIHPEKSKLSYYNLRGWLSEDGEPLPIPPFFTSSVFLPVWLTHEFPSAACHSFLSQFLSLKRETVSLL